MPQILLAAASLYEQKRACVAIVLLVAYFIIRTIYRLYFHPLAKFPGPKIAAATSCFEFYFSVVKDGVFPWKIKELHEQYGKSRRYSRTA